jgi:hypothetical protein
MEDASYHFSIQLFVLTQYINDKNVILYYLNSLYQTKI